MTDPTPFRWPIPLTLVMTAMIGALLLGCGPHNQESLDLSAPAAAKVDPELTRTASQLLAAGHGDSLVTVLVRVKGTGAETALAKKGMQVDTVIGDVATGRVAPRALAELAALDEVIMIEPARQLEIK
jgi:hypothetical protein